MEYWLLDYGSKCSMGWSLAGGSDCVEDSPIYVRSPTHFALPVPTIADLGQVSLTSNASSGGMDTIIMSADADLYSVSDDDNDLNLAHDR
jgi:hypothetical protein